LQKEYFAAEKVPIEAAIGKQQQKINQVLRDGGTVAPETNALPT
jgi:hypothetical protein